MTTRKRGPSDVVWSMDDGKVVVDVAARARRPFGKPEHGADDVRSTSRSQDEVSGPHNRPHVLDVDTDEGSPVTDDVATEDDGAPL